MNGAPGYQSLFGFTTGTASYPGLTPSKPLLLNASRIVTSGDVDLKTQTTGTLPVTRGGTGSTAVLVGNRIMISAAAQSILEGSALTNGQLFIGSTGAAPVAASVTAGSTSLVVTPGAGTLSINTAQGITTAATPTFAAATLTKDKPRLDILSNIAGFGPASSATLALQGSTAVAAFTIVQNSSGDITINNGSGRRMDFAIGGVTWFSIDAAGLVELSTMQLNNTLRMLSLTPSMPVVTDGSSYLTSAAIALATQVSGLLAVANGGTNSSAALTNSKLMVSVGGAIVEGTSSSTPTFTGLTVSAAGAATTLVVANTQIAAGVSSVIRMTGSANPGTNASTLTVDDAGTLVINAGNSSLGLAVGGVAIVGVNAGGVTATALSTVGTATVGSLTASMPVQTDGTKTLVSAAVNLATGAVTGTLPVTKGGTGLAATTINQVLYSSATNTIAGITTANNGVLCTGLTGVPIISASLPIAVQVLITSVGTLTTAVAVSNTTDSTSVSTGSINTAGGIGAAKALWVGGLANVAGVATLANTTDASSTTVGGTVVTGGLAVAKKAFFGDVIAATTAGVRQGSYAFRSEVTTAQTIAPNADTVLTFTTAGNSSGVTYATGAFTVDKAGMYACAADCNWFGGTGTTTTTSEFIIWATVNNVSNSRKGYLSTSIAHFISMSTVLDLAAGDVVRFTVHQTSTGNIIFGLGGGGAGTGYAHASVVLLNVR